MRRNQQGGVIRRAPGRTARRSGVLAAGLLTAGLLVPSGAAAKSFTVGYDFGNDRAGNAGWVPDNSPAPAEDPAGGDWYRSTFATGGGLRIVPKGNGDAPYKDVRGTWWYYAPSGSTIKRARVEGLNGRAVDRQIARAWLFDLRPDPPLPRPSNVSREIREAGTGPTTWDNTSFTLSPSAGMTSGGFGLWLYANPCGPDQDGGTCTPVGPDSEAFISLRKLTMTLDDPTKATTKVDGLGDGTLWTNTNAVGLKVASSDPQSGIAKMQAEVQTPTGTRKFSLGEWRPDTLNSTARGAGVPPLAVDRSAERAVTAASKGRTRVTIRTTNGAGATTVSRGAVRVDREKPTITWPSTVKAGTRVTVRDPASGVRADAMLRVEGTNLVDRCGDVKRLCTLKVPAGVPSRARISIGATDVAGNVATGSRRSVKVKALVPPPSNTPRGPVTTVQNVRIAGPNGEPFTGDATIEWADPGLVGGEETRDVTPYLFDGRVENGVIPRMEVPTDAITKARGRSDQSLNVLSLLRADAGWSTNQYDVWDVGPASPSAAARTRSGTRPLPSAPRPLSLRALRSNPMLLGYDRKASAQATARAAPSPNATFCGDPGEDQVWLVYPAKGLKERSVNIFEVHSWSNETFSFTASNLKSVKSGVAITGSLKGAGVTNAGGIKEQKSESVSTSSEVDPQQSRYRGFVFMRFDTQDLRYVRVDRTYYKTYTPKPGARLPHGKDLADMKCPGDSDRDGYAVVQAATGIGTTKNGSAPKGIDGYVYRAPGGKVRDGSLYDQQPGSQKSLSFSRTKSYAVEKGFSVGAAVANVETTQVSSSRTDSIAKWRYRDRADHYFGGRRGNTIKEWPVIYAGQKR